MNQQAGRPERRTTVHNKTRISLYAFVTVALFLAVSGCSSGEPVAGSSLEARVVPTSLETGLAATEPAPATADTAGDVSTWSNLDLPKPTSSLVTANGYVLYEALEKGSFALLVVDATTGEEVRRHRIDPLGRIPGVLPSPAVNEDANVYLRANIVSRADPYRGLVEALDLDTGAVVWSRELDWPRPPMDCGEWFCVRESGGRLSKLDPATGDLLNEAFFEGVDLARFSDGLTIRATYSDRGLRSIQASTDYGFERTWEVDAEEIFELLGQRVSTGGGWWSRRDLEAGVLAQGIGPDWTDDTDFETAPAGAVVAFGADTGEIVWSKSNVYFCGDGSGTVLVVCDKSGIDEEDYFLSREVTAVKVATGEVIWQHSFDDPVRVGLVTTTTGNGKIVLSVDGEVVVVDSVPELESDEDLLTCVIADSEWIEFTPVWAESRDRRTYIARDVTAPCLSDGTILDTETALATYGTLPDGHALEVDRWWIYRDRDRNLRGLRLDKG